MRLVVLAGVVATSGLIGSVCGSGRTVGMDGDGAVAVAPTEHETPRPTKAQPETPTETDIESESESKTEAAPEPVAEPPGGWPSLLVMVDDRVRSTSFALAMDPLPEGVASVALVVRPQDDTRDGHIECRDELVVREVRRETLDALRPHLVDDAWLAFELTTRELGVGRKVIGACVRDTAGTLHGDDDRLGYQIELGSNRWRTEILTPSGWFDDYDLGPGDRVATLDPSRGYLTETTVVASRQVEHHAELGITLTNGARLRTPASRRYAVDGRRDFVRADALAVGDGLVTEDGSISTIAAVGEPERFDFERPVLDVGFPDTYVIDGFLVADHGHKASDPAPLPALPRMPPVDFRALSSADCMLMTRLALEAPVDGGITLHVAAHSGPAGALTEPSCEPDTRVATVPEDALTKALADPVVARHSLVLEQWIGGPVTCSRPYALTACDGAGRPIGRARYGLSGAPCLAEGTPIATPAGDVPIEALRPGDAVYGYDHERDRTVVVHVQRTRSSKQAVGRITLEDGTTLEATAAHPIWVEALGDYRPAGELDRGHALRLSTGTAAIERIGPFERRTTVVDISVDGPHNYFAAGVLVHNY